MGLITSLRHHLLEPLPIYRAMQHRRRFPGLAIAPDAHIDERLQLAYGADVSIGTRAILTGTGEVRLEDGCYVGRSVEVGPIGRILIQEGTSLQDRCILLGDLSIGRYCLFAPNVYLSSGRHYHDLLPHWLIKDQDAHVQATPDLQAVHSLPITIEDDCWLGINVVVMRGVTIGKGCVVGANSVVTQDLPPYSVAAGVPARILKQRLDFSPPREVRASNSEDHPYFYRGFDLRQAEMARDLPLGGLRARGEFCLALAATAASRLVLTVRSAGAGGVLEFQEQRVEAGERAQELSFAIHQPTDRLVLRWQAENHAGLLVQEARIE